MKTPSDIRTSADRKQIEDHGLTVDQVEAQLERFRKGFGAVQLDRPCRVGDGILQIAPEDHGRLIGLHEEAAAEGRMMKFVPASGAASRMFRELLVFYQEDSAQAELTPELTRFFTLLPRFAFYPALKDSMAAHGQDVDSVLAAQDYHQILKFVLTEDGLNYGHYPKALIPFHQSPEEVRTALAEHLIESTEYIRDKKGGCRLHFTRAPEFADAFKAEVERVASQYARHATHFEITYSSQATQTDTIAADLGNQAFRDEEGHLVFRPGGHGALLQNLNALDADIVFIKNIDNVVASSRRDEQALYKKLLGGLLIQTQQRVFDLIGKLADPKVSENIVAEAIHFIEPGLGVTLPQEIRQSEPAAQAQSLQELLNRPIRVCGVVTNAGEPGGGPFWVRESTGAVSKQLVEAVQVRRSDAEQERILTAATHFNPVDLVCSVRDRQGHVFDLSQYQDPEMGIISGKSYQGRELKALEWPGLWNGAMAHWITLFVEVPLGTFAPVKSVNDLLRPEHQ